MVNRISAALLSCLLVPHACSDTRSGQASRLQHRASGNSPEVIALYEAWFGHPKHISVGYSSQDTSQLNQQIRRAQQMGITAFIVDWYGDREPFIDRSYALMQQTAEKAKFKVAMMYDETDEEQGATDEALADLP